MYRGSYTHYLQEIYLGFGSATLPDYQAGTIDTFGLDAGSLPVALQTMPQQIHRIPQFDVHYLTFNTYMKPFNDVRLRQAFSMAIDRTLLTQSVLKGIAQPTYTLLMRNFPGYNPNLKVPFDPARAQGLLAQAGYPGGKGFPQLTIWVRGVGTQAGSDALAVEYIQGQIQKNLGISISVAQYDFKTFTDAINNHKQPIMLVPYNYDYIDASNFMDLFITGGRHAWSNATYDAIVKKADSTIDLKARQALYEQAQTLMLKEAPAAFLWNDVANTLWKPQFHNVPTSVIDNTLDNYTRIYVAKQ
jgi:peptide/nickel transport system substrate-binding protein/oligopeptide transport system substrate-binding protein